MRILLRSTLILSVIWVLIFFAMCSSCKDKNCPSFLEYHLPVSITPVRDTFNMGDTLFMTFRFPKTLVDRQARIENVFENFDFRIEARGYRCDIFNKVTTDLFDLQTEVGTDSILSFSSFNLFRLAPVFNGVEYDYKGFFTFKQSGIFAINVFCYSDEDIAPFEIKGACDDRNVYFYCDVNEGEGNNVELVSPYNGNSTFWENQFKLSGGYAFVVKE